MKYCPDFRHSDNNFLSIFELNEIYHFMVVALFLRYGSQNKNHEQIISSCFLVLENYLNTEIYHFMVPLWNMKKTYFRII